MVGLRGEQAPWIWSSLIFTPRFSTPRFSASSPVSVVMLVEWKKARSNRNQHEPVDHFHLPLKLTRQREEPKLHWKEAWGPTEPSTIVEVVICCTKHRVWEKIHQVCIVLVCDYKSLFWDECLGCRERWKVFLPTIKNAVEVFGFALFVDRYCPSNDEDLWEEWCI